uniref:NAD-dependent epimerase/dehydratase family protein n=1 Tax=Salmonella enterica TaxID=28901 RepID=UPI00398C7199
RRKMDSRLLVLCSGVYRKMLRRRRGEGGLRQGRRGQTNEPYAHANVAGIKLGESYNRQYGRDYRSVMPTNLYGPNDNFHPDNSHVIPALPRRSHSPARSHRPARGVGGSVRPMPRVAPGVDLAAGDMSGA